MEINIPPTFHAAMHTFYGHVPEEILTSYAAGGLLGYDVQSSLYTAKTQDAVCRKLLQKIQAEAHNLYALYKCLGNAA